MSDPNTQAGQGGQKKPDAATAADKGTSKDAEGQVKATQEPLVIETNIVKHISVTDTRAVRTRKEQKAYIVKSGKHGGTDKDGKRIRVGVGGRVWVTPETAANMADCLDPLEAQG